MFRQNRPTQIYRRENRDFWLLSFFHEKWLPLLAILTDFFCPAHCWPYPLLARLPPFSQHLDHDSKMRERGKSTPVGLDAGSAFLSDPARSFDSKRGVAGGSQRRYSSMPVFPFCQLQYCRLMVKGGRGASLLFFVQRSPSVFLVAKWWSDSATPLRS